MNTLLDTDPKEQQPQKMSNGLRSFLSGLSLACVACLCITLISYVQHSTADLIASNQNSGINNKLLALLPDSAKEKGSTINCYEIKKSNLVGHNQKLFMISKDLKILGYVMTYSTSLGYSDPLVMIAGFTPDKKVYRADIQFSQETPGLGDKVDRAHGTFLDMFNGLGADDAKWEVRKNGGDFDFITGSTVTSRATVLATYNALRELGRIDHTRLKKCRL